MPEQPATSGTRSLGPRFWRLCTASGLSNLADGVLKLALPLVALQYTRSPLLVAGITVALTLPWLLVALPAGALADRMDRRRLMLAGNIARASLLAALVVLVALDLGSIATLYVVAFCIGVAETVYDTSAQSILPQVVAKELLSRANGRLFATELTAQEFVGPPLGGALVAAGTVLAFATPAALWVVAVGALVLVRGSFRVTREVRTTLRADVAEGLRFVARHRVLRLLALMTGVFNLASSAVGAVLVLYAVGAGSAMGLSGPAFGLLLAATAAGSLVGSFLAERLERRIGRSTALMVGLVAGALFIGGPAVTTNAYAVGAAFFVGGMGVMTWNVVAVSLRQRAAPPQLLGRVSSAYRLVAWGSMPVGAGLGGLIGQTLGLRAVFAVMACVVLSLVALKRWLSDAALDAAEHVEGT
ncbi:MAG: Na+/melibiose symporter-like transporter [Actinotalea sp.]|nr:Na+/melibiose symporter-like transporter [Actinotalea sp.]